MSYENAPATKMLATHCAACGRALVDAVSVESGFGPECRQRFGVADAVTDEVARVEANQIVFQLARGGLARKDARPMFARLAELGFVLLAERVAKRFRTTLEPEPAFAKVEASALAALRAEYAKIRADFCYDNITPKEFNAIVRNVVEKHVRSGDPRPEDFVKVARTMTCACRRCAGTGRFITFVENGVPRGPGGECYRCGGKGRQNLDDAIRNRVFDEHNVARAS